MYLTLHRETYSHIVLIPLVSGLFFLAERRRIFSRPEYALLPGLAVGLAAVLIRAAAIRFGPALEGNDRLSLAVLSALALLSGGFLACFGRRAFRAALFPLLFLLFMVPIPSLVLEKAVSFLVRGSTEAVSILFRATGTPFVREGPVFHLPGISIEIAEQCSGIRSSIALLISAVVAARLFLSSGWSRAVFLLAVVPAALLKNAVRIATLSLLAIHADPAWITGSSLHRKGGVVFFLLALGLLGGLIYLLRSLENGRFKAR